MVSELIFRALNPTKSMDYLFQFLENQDLKSSGASLTMDRKSEMFKLVQEPQTRKNTNNRLFWLFHVCYLDDS